MARGKVNLLLHFMSSAREVELERQAIDLSFGFVIVSAAVSEVGHGLDEVLVLVTRGETSGQLEDFVFVGVGQFRVEFVVLFEFVALVASRECTRITF